MNKRTALIIGPTPDGDVAIVGFRSQRPPAQRLAIEVAAWGRTNGGCAHGRFG